MRAYRTHYKIAQDGEVALHDLPFSKGKELEVILIEEPEKLKNWRERYLEKIFSTSVWSDEVAQMVEQAGKELNQWNIPVS